MDKLFVHRFRYSTVYRLDLRYYHLEVWYIWFLFDWQVWTEIKCKMHGALAKWPINQFQLVQQTVKQTTGAKSLLPKDTYCKVFLIYIWPCLLVSFQTSVFAVSHPESLLLLSGKYQLSFVDINLHFLPSFLGSCVVNFHVEKFVWNFKHFNS